MTVNIAVALLHALKVAVKETASLPGNLDSSAERIIQEFLQASTHSYVMKHYHLTVSRNSLLILTQSSVQLVSRRWVGFATALETPSQMRRSIGLLIPLLKIASPTLVQDAQQP